MMTPTADRAALADVAKQPQNTASMKPQAGSPDAAMRSITAIRSEMSDVERTIGEINSTRFDVRYSGSNTDTTLNYWIKRHEALKSELEGAYQNKSSFGEWNSRDSGRWDTAMLTTPGGIDLSQQDAAMRIVKDANGGVTVNVDPALIARVEREGMKEVIPVIINMQPADMHAILGV
jgi:hypothetical protein